MTDFRYSDPQVTLATMDREDIINSLTLNDVKHFLESLGVEQIVVDEDKQYIICPTICHNPLYAAESMKLYWYQNNKIFRCYTECNEAISIFELYRRYMELNHYPVGIEEAEEYVKNILERIVVSDKKEDKFSERIAKYKFDADVKNLKEYPPQILDYFIKYYHPTWLRDGITKEAMDKFKIGFCINQNKIVIPHFDINGHLVGIRGRALNPEEVEAGQKYRPIKIGNILYNHQLGFNLYGINEHKEAIRKRRCAIIAEAEKSVLLDDGYYGNWSNTVACCGSSINKFQISLLADRLGVSEIVIALDKEYSDSKSEKAWAYRKKLEDICKKYTNHATMSYIWDYKNLLNEKDSPFDKGKEVFEELFKHRIKVR